MKRSIEIKVRLNRKEAEMLDKRVKKSGLSREGYLRHLIGGFIPREAPPTDYFAMMQQLYRIGNSMNQVAQKAHTLNVIDVQRYDAAYRQFESVVREITSAVVEPQKMDFTGAPQSCKTLRGEEHPRSDKPFAARGKSVKRSAV